MTEYCVVPYPKSAEAFLYSTFLRSLREMGALVGQLTYTEFCPLMHSRMEEMMATRPIALALSARDAPDWIGGWIVSHARPEGLFVHWIYVRHTFRMRGFAATLLDAALRQAGEPERIFATHDPRNWTRRGGPNPRFLDRNDPRRRLTRRFEICEKLDRLGIERSEYTSPSTSKKETA